jgi:substrate import-associated zinc metallohydrolase lipoprotein
MRTKIIYAVIISFFATAFTGCYKDESLNTPQKPDAISTDTLDAFIQENFLDPYNIAIRYKYVDRYVDGDKRVVPPSREIVEPMLNFITYFLIESFNDVENGEAFFTRYFPKEVVLIGSPIYNNDGTVTLGTADAGARITLTEVNAYNLDDTQWVQQQLHTIFHEFAHIVHQNFNLPTGWETISAEGYTSSGSWYTLSDEEALERGFTTPYATSSFNEDFAETVAHILFFPEFYDLYITDETNCTDLACEKRNAGRAKIRKKYNAVLNHYKQYVGVDLLKVREIVQAKLN